MVICQCIKAQAGLASVVLRAILDHVGKMVLLAIMAVLDILDQWAQAILAVPAAYLDTRAAWA
jgi:hypothetical protein